MEANGQAERELLQSLKQGDVIAFNTIYKRYSSMLAARIMRMVKSEALTEELLQDLFLRLWSGRESIDPTLSVKSYLYKVAQNMVIDVLRRAAKEQHIHSQIIAVSTELYQHVEERLFEKEYEALLHDAIDHLPPQRKKIFVHCKLEGMSYKEVAELYGISQTTVNDHIQKSMHFIRDYLLRERGFQVTVLLAFILS